NTKVFKKQNDINLLIEKLEKMLVDFQINYKSTNNSLIINRLNSLLALCPQKKEK
ncbi:site-specific DNA-methyltransferase, partial [Mycoplasma flocculare]|nr:site-specific DNA-methyltransferase [Mesomycoplasma flocculare]